MLAQTNASELSKDIGFALDAKFNIGDIDIISPYAASNPIAPDMIKDA